MTKEELIRQVIRLGQREGWTYDDTADFIRQVRKGLRLKPPKRSRRLPDIMTESEEKKFFSTLEKYYSWEKVLFFTLLRYTGLRVAEACRLRKRDIDFERLIIRVEKGKGDKDRYVPFPERMSKDLRHIFELYPKHDYVFVNRNTGQPYTPRRFQQIAADVCKKAKIRDIRITPHTFRHALATELLNRGLDIRIVQEILGHESIMTTEVYTHIAIEKIQEEYQRVMA